MSLDTLPFGGGSKKRASKSQIQKLIKGGRIADEVHARERRHHHAQELPQAEKEMGEALKSWPEKEEPRLPTAAEEMHAPVKHSFWSKVFPFFSEKP